ncbi:transcriptional regulator SplA domain-containing protein [Alteribacillus sp. JSM 102045]|uniref:transcriptional regulator SplA domain-containing protein n=1 Tax=Alteribacillus sp. JSM 102045 TaxID=1562101 RepID=UPI0035C12192
MSLDNLQPGDVKYVFFRNPHSPDVATIHAVKVMIDPENEKKLCLFADGEIYSLDEEYALFSTYQEALTAYDNIFAEADY